MLTYKEARAKVELSIAGIQERLGNRITVEFGKQVENYDEIVVIFRDKKDVYPWTTFYASEMIRISTELLNIGIGEFDFFLDLDGTSRSELRAYCTIYDNN